MKELGTKELGRCGILVKTRILLAFGVDLVPST